MNTDPNFKAIEEQFLMFPLVEKDYDNWNTMGSALFLRDKALLTPTVKDRRGLMYTTKPNPKPNHWLVHVDFKIGNKEFPHRSGEGMAITYLRDVDQDNPDLMNNFYGFTNEFRGLGIFINTGQGFPDRKTKRKVVNIFGFANDGKNVRPTTKNERQCYREVLGDYLHFSKIAIEYEKPLLRVSTYDHDSKEF